MAGGLWAPWLHPNGARACVICVCVVAFVGPWSTGWLGQQATRIQASLPAWSGQLSAEALKMGTLCFQERFLYGLAVLEVDMRKHGRLTRRAPKQPAAEAGVNGLSIHIYIYI